MKKNILIFVVLSILTNSFASVPKDRHPNEQIALFEAHLYANITNAKVTYIGRTPSMLGVLKPGSIITYRAPRLNEDYKVGQVAIYRSIRAEYPTIVHQITAVREEAVYFQGSFNTMGDGWVKKDRIIGIVTKNFVW